MMQCDYQDHQMHRYCLWLIHRYLIWFINWRLMRVVWKHAIDSVGHGFCLLHSDLIWLINRMLRCMLWKHAFDSIDHGLCCPIVVWFDLQIGSSSVCQAFDSIDIVCVWFTVICLIWFINWKCICMTCRWFNIYIHIYARAYIYQILL